MGFFRGSAFIIVSVLLFISLLGTGFFYMISLSLDYDVVKDELVGSADQMVREMGVYDDFVNGFVLIEMGCEELPSYNFSTQGETFEIPCDIVGKGVEEVFNYVLEDFVMGGYNNEYDCSLLNCWEETKNPSFLISEKTRNYAVSKVYFLFLVSLILIGLMFLLIENRSSLPFVVGGLLIVVSLLFMKLDSVLSFIDDKLILNFVSVFLTKTYSVFVRFMSIGVGIITIGIILKFFLIGFKINAFVGWIKNKIAERKKGKKGKEKKEVKVQKNLVKNKKGEIVLDE